MEEEEEKKDQEGIVPLLIWFFWGFSRLSEKWEYLVAFRRVVPWDDIRAGVIRSVLEMGRQRSLRSKAAHFVSDLTTVLLNPISDKPSSKPSPPSQSPVSLPSSAAFLKLLLRGVLVLDSVVELTSFS